MTAKYNMVLPSQYKDPSGMITAQLNKATELMAFRVNETDECLTTRICLASKRVATRARTIVVPVQAAPPATALLPDVETGAAWTRRMIPSLVIAVWFGVVFLILALTAPQSKNSEVIVEHKSKEIVRPSSLMPPPTIGAP